MIRTPICDLLGIQYPIFQGGMAWIADADLAAAVSNGGGLAVSYTHLILSTWYNELVC